MTPEEQQVNYDQGRQGGTRTRQQTYDPAWNENNMTIESIPENQQDPGNATEIRRERTLNPNADFAINVEHLNFYYGKKQALFDVSLPLRNRQVTALIGPSGCGKSTFLRTLNRMNDLIP